VDGYGRYLSVVPIRQNCIYQEKTFYATIASSVDKGSSGVLHLLDSAGNILQKIENTNYSGIEGLTDVDRDGNQELIIFYGSSYGGGVTLLGFGQDQQGLQPKLVEKARMATVFD
jgi:hypothetical protein